MSFSAFSVLSFCRNHHLLQVHSRCKKKSADITDLQLFSFVSWFWLDCLCSFLATHNGLLLESTLILTSIRFLCVFTTDYLVYTKVSYTINSCNWFWFGCSNFYIFFGKKVIEQLESWGCQIRTSCEVYSVFPADEGSCLNLLIELLVQWFWSNPL